MAKSKSFFGLRTGSTKSLTFQVYRGQQITKDRVTRISNPRSEAQMRQRAIIPIVAASRAALKGLVDHSFEGVAYGEQSLKKFSELNLRAGALNVVSYSPNGYSNPGFASLIVSQGSLYNGGIIIQNTPQYDSIEYHIRATTSDKIKFKAAKAGDDPDEVLATIADWGTKYCHEVAPGNQLTFLTVSSIGSVEVGNNDAPISAFDICRLLFPSSENTPAQIVDVNGLWKVKNDVAEGDENVTLYNKNFEILIYVDYGDHLIFTVHPTNHLAAKALGGALIRSAYVNGTWKRSNGTIHFVQVPMDGAYTYEMWRSYYESTGTSAKYLNQGKESTGIN